MHHSSVHALLAAVPKVPQTIKQAFIKLRSKAATDDKMGALWKNHIWYLVLSKACMNMVGSEWVFKTKLNVYESLNKHKADIVARGFTQI